MSEARRSLARWSLDFRLMHKVFGDGKSIDSSELEYQLEFV
jgi:hypothetical protein